MFFGRLLIPSERIPRPPFPVSRFSNPPPKRKSLPALYFPPGTGRRCFPESLPISLAARYLTRLNNFALRRPRAAEVGWHAHRHTPPRHSPPLLFSYTALWFTRHGGGRWRRGYQATMIDHRETKIPPALKPSAHSPMSEKHSLVKPPLPSRGSGPDARTSFLGQRSPGYSTSRDRTGSDLHSVREIPFGPCGEASTRGRAERRKMYLFPGEALVISREIARYLNDVYSVETTRGASVSSLPGEIKRISSVTREK